MKSLFTLEAEIEGRSIKVQVREDLDVFAIAKSIAIEHQLGPDSEQEIMIVILQTLAELMESDDQELKEDICKILSNTVLDKPRQAITYFQHNNQRANKNTPKTLQKILKPVTLYERALRSKQNKENTTERVKMLERQQQIQGCTFHPKVNRSQVHTGPRHEILYKNAQTIKEKHEKVRKYKEEHETDGFTFCPEINEQSTRMANNRSSNSFKRESFQEEFPFQPTLSKGTQKLASQFPAFEKRLQKYILRSQRVSSPQQRKSVNAGSHKRQKPDKYKERFQDEEKDQERRMKLYGLVSTECKHRHQAGTHPVPKNNKSEELFEKKKQRTFNQIFRGLEWDGIVSDESIGNNNLQPELCVVLEPLLTEISQLQVSLNKQEFINSLDRLYNSLRSIDKQVIISTEAKRKWRQGHQEYLNKYNFRPTISDKSKDLAIRRELRPLVQNPNCADESFESRFTIEEEEEESNGEIQLI